ncbi:hypothetical protein [Paenibacillus lautus]|uniref:hypothetical protein n=1 Tax=Paenibacillus lautus TaxID=1401 RepID=UPI001C7CAAAF|nr:hypothetical protein [Paenibacillus lautus]MBX4152219.1 hypothetical protein [Paenibacillus lautus]
MNYEEYMKGELPEDKDLPSSFLSDEDLPGNINVIIIPDYKINLDLILDTCVEQCSKAKTKEELKQYLQVLWNHAATHGSLSERLNKLQEDVDTLQFDLMYMNGYDIEYIDGEDE